MATNHYPGHEEYHSAGDDAHDHHRTFEHADEVEGFARDKVHVASARDERHRVGEGYVLLWQKRGAGYVRVYKDQRRRLVGGNVDEELEVHERRWRRWDASEPGQRGNVEIPQRGYRGQG